MVKPATPTTTTIVKGYLLSASTPSDTYGNGMFLEYVLRTIGHEPVPVGLTFRPLGDYGIDTIETSVATWCTVLLTVIPAVISLGVGIVVIVRRKNR